MDEDLTDIEKIRKRPEMYFGGIDNVGVLNYALEIFSNAIDAVYRRERPRVSISALSPNFVISDNGHGFRLDVERFLENHSVTRFSSQKYLEKFHTTPTADNHAPHFHAGRAAGIGLVGVNALSEYFRIETWQKNKLWTCEYSKGEILQPFKVTGSGKGTGSTVSFRPDPEIFTGYTDIHASFRARVKSMSYLVPGITYEFLDDVYYSENGIFDLLGKEIPVFRFDEALLGFRIYIAMGGHAKQSKWQSWVNGVRSYLGGSHHEAVELALKEFNWTPANILIHLIGLDFKYAGPTTDRIIAQGLVLPMKERLIERLDRFSL